MIRVTPGMRASVSPRVGQVIEEMGHKDSDPKRILDVQSLYVVVRNNRTRNHSVISRKTLWRYVITEVPDRSANPVRITIAHDGTGEIREWWMTERKLRAIYLALQAAPRIPAYLASCFDFARRRARS